jgi:hypothetical protein
VLEHTIYAPFSPASCCLAALVGLDQLIVVTSS